VPVMTGAKFLAETLSRYGLSHYFFMPVSVPSAMPEFDLVGIESIMAHSEKGAAYMADGYARVAGRIGVCGSQSVGALNMAAGLQDAYLGCSPVLALTGRLAQKSQGRNAYQEVDHNSPFEAVTKYSTTVTAPDELPIFLRQALREAVSSTPGPVHLDLYGIAGNIVMEGEADLEVVVEEQFCHVPPFRPIPEESDLFSAIELLSSAKRPVIVAGGGVRASGAREELLQLSEQLKIPVVTSLNAKDTFPARHPLAVGVSGVYSRECSNKILALADLVFFVGSHTGEQVTNQWKLPRAGAKVIQLDINPSELGRSFPVNIGLSCDAKAGLKELVTRFGQHEVDSERNDWVKVAKDLVGEWYGRFEPLMYSDAMPMRPERLCHELAIALPPDSILVSDTGHAGIWTGTMIDFHSPDQDYIRCAGSLGWGIPAAVGAKCAASDRPVICFTGDGGVWYHVAELNTAARNGINVITIVNNNASLNQEQALNERNYGGRSERSDRLWMLGDTDFAAMAESMGCLGITVRRPAEFISALGQAFDAKWPTLIDVKTDIEGIAPRAWD